MTDQFVERLKTFEKAYMKNLSIIISKMNKRSVLDHILELEYKIGHTMNKSHISEFQYELANKKINYCLKNIYNAVMTDFSERIKKDADENTGYYIDLILGKV